MNRTGLFGVAGSASRIRGVGLTGVAVRASHDMVGGLVGVNLGVVSGSYAAGRVTGDYFVGGLVGWNLGLVAASYATGRVAGDLAVGGLAGLNSGVVAASYATGRVAGRTGAGGLVGHLSGGTVSASYATGPVSAPGNVGGLVGTISSIYGGDVTASYWDTRTSGVSGGEHGEGRSTAALEGPTGYTGLYRGWIVDLDGDRRQESPWNFGTGREYPVLALDLDGSGQATWQEMGRQLRAGPALRAAGQPTEVALTWTAVDASQWIPRAGDPLHGVPRRGRRHGDPRRGHRCPAVRRYRRCHRDGLYLSGSGGRCRRRGDVERAGEGDRGQATAAAAPRRWAVEAEAGAGPTGRRRRWESWRIGR